MELFLFFMPDSCNADYDALFFFFSFLLKALLKKGQYLKYGENNAYSNTTYW